MDDFPNWHWCADLRYWRHTQAHNKRSKLDLWSDEFLDTPAYKVGWDPGAESGDFTVSLEDYIAELRAKLGVSAHPSPPAWLEGALEG